MVDIKLTRDMIRQRATDKSYTRGQDYYRNGAIYETVKRGDTIEARCYADSRATPYRLSVRFDKNGIVDARCNCQYTYGGDCKHIVALLLTYLQKPELFEELAPVEDILTERSKEELIALIKKMVNRYPDLQSLLSQPSPRKNATGATVDTSAFRKMIKRALKRFYDDDEGIFEAIDSVMESAAEFVAQNDWINASAIYQAILREVMDGPEEVMLGYDEEGYLSGKIDEVITSLADCIEHLDGAPRGLALNALVDVYIWSDDLDLGDVAADVPQAVTQYARPEDVPAIRQKLTAAQDTRRRRWANAYAVENYTRFLADLDEVEQVDPEVTLKRLRDEGMYRVLVRKLLNLGRIDEALDVVRKYIPNLREVLYEFTQTGHDKAAIRLAEQALKTHHDDFVLGTLLELLNKQNDRQRYFNWILYRVQHSPTLIYYLELRAVATELGNWETVQPEIMRRLEKEHQYNLLAEIYLEDGAWDEAWDAAEKSSKSSASYNAYGWARQFEPGLMLRVAEKSRFDRPQKAIPVLLEHAHKLIDMRNRNSYQYAAQILVKIREVYEREKQFYDAWKTLIADIRQKYKQLRALQEELTNAGL